MVKTGSSAFLLLGSDSYLKEKAIKDLASSISDTPTKDLDNKVFYGGEASAGEVLDHVNAAPFLASKRVVLIRDLDKASVGFIASLIGYLKKPSESTCLIMEASSESILKDHPDLAGYAEVKRFGGMSESQLNVFIRDLLAARKKKIDSSASELLKEMHGQNLHVLSQELEKLSAFVGARSDIKVQDVEELSGRSLVSSAFDLADAIGARNAEEALRVCRQLSSVGKKEYEIIGLLCWHLKRLLKAKKMQSAGESDGYIASALRIGPKYKTAFFRQIAALGTNRIKSGIRSLLEADMDIKRTRFDYAHSNLVLEFAIIKLTS